MYVGSIRLARPLDFDTVSSYKLTVKAVDGGLKNVLSSTANVTVVVKDVQDERPVFTNSPYSIVIDENTPAGVQVLMVTAEDGDAGHKRPIVLSVEDDYLSCFAIQNAPNGTGYIYTSDNPIDRENRVITDAGGIYTFRLKVLLNGVVQVPGHWGRSYPSDPLCAFNNNRNRLYFVIYIYIIFSREIDLYSFNVD